MSSDLTTRSSSPSSSTYPPLSTWTGPVSRDGTEDTRDGTEDTRDMSVSTLMAVHTTDVTWQAAGIGVVRWFVVRIFVLLFFGSA